MVSSNSYFIQELPLESEEDIKREIALSSRDDLSRSVLQAERGASILARSSTAINVCSADSGHEQRG